MPEIQSLISAGVFKYMFSACAGFVAVISAMTVHIFRLLKKDVEEIKNMQKLDHDRLDKLETEHKVFHKGKTGLK